jgi:hypothetical protein
MPALGHLTSLRELSGAFVSDRGPDRSSSLRHAHLHVPTTTNLSALRQRGRCDRERLRTSSSADAPFQGNATFEQCKRGALTEARAVGRASTAAARLSVDEAPGYAGLAHGISILTTLRELRTGDVDRDGLHAGQLSSPRRSRCARTSVDDEAWFLGRGSRCLQRLALIQQCQGRSQQ